MLSFCYSIWISVSCLTLYPPPPFFSFLQVIRKVSRTDWAAVTTCLLEFVEISAAGGSRRRTAVTDALLARSDALVAELQHVVALCVDKSRAMVALFSHGHFMLLSVTATANMARFAAIADELQVQLATAAARLRRALDAAA